MRLSRSKVSILLSLVTILAIVGAFMVTALVRGQATHASGVHAASGATQTQGSVVPVGSDNLSNAPTATSAGPAQVLQPDPQVNLRGVNGVTTPSGSGSGTPQTTGMPVSALGTASHSSLHRSAPKAGQLLQTFDGVSILDTAVTTGFALAPPDQGLCVGPLASFGQEVVIEPVNLAYRIFSTSGTTLFGPAPLSFLFQEPPFPTEFISDPRCHFDQATGDFFFTILAFNFPAETLSHIDVTVLHQNGVFFTYRFDTTDAGFPHCPCFADQPLLGIDAFNLYVSGNEFPIKQPSPFFNGAEVYVISKSQLASGTGGTANFAEFSNISDQGVLIETLQPAITFDPKAPAEYLLHSFVVDANGNNTSFDHRLGIFAITNQAAVTAGGFPTLSFPTVINSELYAQPNSAFQPSINVLNPDDDRMQQVEYINGNLMGALSTGILIKGDTTPRDGAAWFDIEPSLKGSLTVKAHIKRQGYIAVAGLYILYPAIMQSSDGNVEMAFSITNSTTNPSAAYAVVPDGTKGGKAGAVFVAATGTGPYFDTFTCTGPAAPGCRWGDYSWAILDPLSSNIWMATEYVPPPARQISISNWGTRVYEVSA